ncbi:MAG: hypothetical protein NTV43_18195 [Methylococcales bacterium]|nr:hypothetical protein [Methylococcales bacterium]
MDIVIGAPATGSNYFPRSHISIALQLALRLEHVLFLAPRRTGKTSVLLDLHSNPDVITVWLNLEGYHHPEQWIDALIAELGKINDDGWLSKFKNYVAPLKRVKSEYLEIEKADWQSKGQQLIADLQELNTPIWFLLDEFPIMIDNIAKTHNPELAAASLHWLRSLRQQNPNSPVRFLLTGSIGLDSVLKRHSIRGVANDLRREVLTPLTPEEALAFTLQLAADNAVNLPEALAQHYIASLGAGLWPFFIQLFIAELQTSSPPTSTEDIDIIFKSLAHSQRNQYASNMRERLGEIFTPVEKAIALNLLKLLAPQPTGMAYSNLRAQVPNALDEEFDLVLEVLKHDGYLTETADQQLQFFSNLLRSYWLQKVRA